MVGCVILSGGLVGTIAYLHIGTALSARYFHLLEGYGRILSFLAGVFLVNLLFNDKAFL